MKKEEKTGKKKLKESQRIFASDEDVADPFGDDGQAQSFNPDAGKNLIDM